jgi:glycosyltransferase involved in cell wall biosynthesis
VRIQVYSICWNEAALLPHFLRHYRFAEKIVIYDHNSTDDSVAIMRSFPNTTIRMLPFSDEIHEDHYLTIKNHAYQECRGQADFVIVVDVDEFVYHPFLLDLLQSYKGSGVTLPKIKGYNMVSERFPEGHEAILRAVRHGVPDDVDMDGYLNAYGKRCIFHPSIDINYEPGCHECSPQGEVRESETAEIKMLHYKYLGLEYTLKRFAAYKQRLSEENIKQGWGFQYRWSEDRIVDLFNTMREKVVQVL